MSLEEILNQTVAEHPSRFSDESVERVRDFIEYYTSRELKKKPYRRFLVDIEDWQLYYSLHPKWAGKTVHKLRSDHKSGGGSFYRSFIRWANKQSTCEDGKIDKVKRKKITGTLFNGKRVSKYHYLKTIGDWVTEFNSHPEWAGRSTKDMNTDIKSGANVFYQNFLRWTRNEATDENSKVDKSKRKNLIHTIFPRKVRDWSSYITLDDWVTEFKSHPEWAGRSTKDMISDKESGASSYYDAFLKWVRKKSMDENGKIDPKKRTELIGKVLTFKINYRHYTSIDEWVEEFNSHPGWVRRSSNDMKLDPKSGADSFYQAFCKWVKKESTDENGKVNESKRKNLFHTIFSRKVRDWSSYTTLDDWIAEFNSHPEWDMKSVLEMAKDMDSGANAFYKAFYAWTRNEATDENGNFIRGKCQKLRRSLFGPTINISKLHKSIKEGNLSLEEAVEIVKRKVSIKTGLGIRENSTILFPEILYKTIYDSNDKLNEGTLKNFEFYKRKSIESMNAVKLGMKRDDYFRFLQQVFYDGGSLEFEKKLLDARRFFADESCPDEDFKNCFLDDHTFELIKFFTEGDLSKVSTIEELVAESTKNPNFRVRMLLATNPDLESNQTLDSFVKLYANKEERDVDVEVNNYLTNIARIKSVGTARSSNMKEIKVKRDESKGTATIYTKAKNFPNSLEETCTHAIITPFINAQALMEVINDSEEDNVENDEDVIDKEDVVVSLLKEVNAAAYELHQKGYAHLDDDFIPLEQRKFLRQKLEGKSYQTLFEENVTSKGTLLHQVYCNLNIGKQLDAYREDNACFVHGDLHPMNILVDEDGEKLFIDFEMAHIGIAQEDLVQTYGFSKLNLSIDEQEELVSDYAEISGKNVVEFERTYHLMGIHKKLQNCKFFAALEDRKDVYLHHRNAVLEHAKILFSEDQVKELERAIVQEFEQQDQDIYDVA